jgi:hypothetical protein
MGEGGYSQKRLSLIVIHAHQCGHHIEVPCGPRLVRVLRNDNAVNDGRRVQKGIKNMAPVANGCKAAEAWRILTSAQMDGRMAQLHTDRPKILASGVPRGAHILHIRLLNACHIAR